MTLRNKLGLAAGALAVAAAAPAARADSVNDLANGSTIYMQWAKVHLDTTSYEAAGYAITKPAGTLDFDVPASALGLPWAVTLHLTHINMGAGLLAFKIDQSFSGFDIDGDGDLLTNLDGYIYVATAIVPGGNKPQCGQGNCMGDVSLTVLPILSNVVATGTWGSETVFVDAGTGIGGVTQPPISAFYAGISDPICSTGVPATIGFPLIIQLANVAPTGGTRVDLTYPTNAGVTGLHNTLVPAGQDWVALGVKAKTGYAGTMILNAAAGGASTTFDLTIHAAADCEPPNSKPQYEAYVPPWLLDCGCTTFVDFNNEGDQLLTVSGQVNLIHDGVATPLTKLFPNVSAVAADSINDVGMIAGRMIVNGVTVAYRANMVHGSSAPQILGQMIPMDLGSAGTVVGYRVDAVTGLHVPVYSLGNSVVDLPFSFAIKEARALHIGDDGQIVGTYTDTGGTIRGYRWINGTTTTMPNVGAGPAIPVALNSSDQVAVNSVNANGNTIAARLSAQNAITLLGLPSGYVSFEAKSMNRWGWIAGVATTAKGIQRGYVWNATSGFTALTGYVKGLTVDDTLRITDANQVVVHATIGSSTDLYLVTL